MLVGTDGPSYQEELELVAATYGGPSGAPGKAFASPNKGAIRSEMGSEHHARQAA